MRLQQSQLSRRRSWSVEYLDLGFRLDTTTGYCNQCMSTARAAPLPQFRPPPTRPQAIPGGVRHHAPLDDPHEMTTVHDDQPPPWNRQEMIEKAQGLRSKNEKLEEKTEFANVKFECPYCEAALPAHARSCHRCKKAL